MANNTTELLFQHPNSTSVTGFLLDYPNQVILQGTLAYFILFTTFSISFVMMMRTDTLNAFRASAFTTFVMGTMLAGLGVLGAYGWALTVILLLTAFAVGGRGGV